MDLRNVPDWAPFACLITGKMPLRKPFLTRIAEAVFMGIVSAALTLYVGVKMLERDFIAEKGRLDAHLVRFEAQIVKRDAELARDRLERQAGVDAIVRKLERIEDCIRTRTCTR